MVKSPAGGAPCSAADSHVPDMLAPPVIPNHNPSPWAACARTWSYCTCGPCLWRAWVNGKWCKRGALRPVRMHAREAPLPQKQIGHRCRKGVSRPVRAGARGSPPAGVCVTCEKPLHEKGCGPAAPPLSPPVTGYGMTDAIGFSAQYARTCEAGSWGFRRNTSEPPGGFLRNTRGRRPACWTRL